MADTDYTLIKDDTPLLTSSIQIELPRNTKAELLFAKEHLQKLKTDIENLDKKCEEEVAAVKNKYLNLETPLKDKVTELKARYQIKPLRIAYQKDLSDDDYLVLTSIDEHWYPWDLDGYVENKHYIEIQCYRFYQCFQYPPGCYQNSHIIEIHNKKPDSPYVERNLMVSRFMEKKAWGAFLIVKVNENGSLEGVLKDDPYLKTKATDKCIVM